MTCRSILRSLLPSFAVLLAAASCGQTDPDHVEPVIPDNGVSFTIEVDAPRSVVVYPFDRGAPVSFPFRIVSDSPLPSLTVEVVPAKGLRVAHTVAADNLSGEILVSGTEEFSDPAADVMITASCGDASSSATVSVERAILEGESGTMSFTSSSGSSAFSILTNLECVLSQDVESRQFASVSLAESVVTVSVSDNPGFSSRGGTVSVSDPAGILPPVVVPFTQAGSSGSRYTDSLALVKFHDEMEMAMWKEQGSFDDLYANWCTEAPLENWCGVTTDSSFDPRTYEDLHDGRVTRLKLLLVPKEGSAWKNTHPIPECIGDLKALVQMDFIGDFVGELPKSLGTLPALNRIHIYNDVGKSGITGDLNDHPLKDIASHIKFWDVSGDLYGTVPVWFSQFADFRLDDTHYSGRIPDEVAASYGMQKQNIWDRTVEGINCWELKEIDATILVNASLSGYALWYGEKTPDGVEFVSDAHDGHWQWKSMADCVAYIRSH